MLSLHKTTHQRLVKQASRAYRRAVRLERNRPGLWAPQNRASHYMILRCELGHQWPPQGLEERDIVAFDSVHLPDYERRLLRIKRNQMLVISAILAEEIDGILEGTR